MDTEFNVLFEWLEHRNNVSVNLDDIIYELKKRSKLHDLSKLNEIEFDSFVQTRPKFEKCDYCSKEYQECIVEIQPAINHHYGDNRHHPEHYRNGFSDMNLIDILEMLADWRAASKRSPNLDFKDSLSTCFEKYKISDDMQRHVINTLEYLGWI